MLAITLEDIPLIVPGKLLTEQLRVLHPDFKGVYWRDRVGVFNPSEGFFLCTLDQYNKLMAATEGLFTGLVLELHDDAILKRLGDPPNTTFAGPIVINNVCIKCVDVYLNGTDATNTILSIELRDARWLLLSKGEATTYNSALYPAVEDWWAVFVPKGFQVAFNPLPVPPNRFYSPPGGFAKSMNCLLNMYYQQVGLRHDGITLADVSFETFSTFLGYTNALRALPVNRVANNLETIKGAFGPTTTAVMQYDPAVQGGSIVRRDYGDTPDDYDLVRFMWTSAPSATSLAVSKEQGPEGFIWLIGGWLNWPWPCYATEVTWLFDGTQPTTRIERDLQTYVDQYRTNTPILDYSDGASQVVGLDCGGTIQLYNAVGVKDFLAVVLGSTAVGGSISQWTYRIQAVVAHKSGYGYCLRSAPHGLWPLSGHDLTAYNLAEDINSPTVTTASTTVQGNGVIPSHLLGTFTYRPIPNGAPVLVRSIIAEDEESADVEYWIVGAGMPNGIDGTCP